MTSTVETKAVVGRRVEFAYHRSLIDDSATVYLPGVITALTEGEAACVRVRLDGTRSNLAVRPDDEGLRYLDEVGAVPELPMGRFHPTAKDVEGEWEGVPVCQFEDEDMVALIADRDAAAQAITAYCTDMGMDMEFVDLSFLQARWVVFEWQPEDAECPWLMNWAAEGDDMAIQINYLPA